MSEPRIKPGYTLIEVLVALAIVGVILGITIPVARSWQELSRLREPAQKLYALVHQTRSDSFNESWIYTIRLQRDRFAVYRSGTQEAIDEYPLPENTRYQLKPWLSDQWLTPDVYEWVIAPLDLLEPLSFRFQRGDQQIEQTYHPVTAQIVDETLFIP